MERRGARNQLGSTGETLAAEFLVGKGFRVLARNLVLKVGEIDLLCRDGEAVVIVEVKSQSSAAFSDPVFKVDAAKRRKLWLLARAVARRCPDRNVRVDVVTVVRAGDGYGMRHLENVLEG